MDTFTYYEDSQYMAKGRRALTHVTSLDDDAAPSILTQHSIRKRRPHTRHGRLLYLQLLDLPRGTPCATRTPDSGTFSIILSTQSYERYAQIRTPRTFCHKTGPQTNAERHDEEHGAYPHAS